MNRRRFLALVGMGGAGGAGCLGGPPGAQSIENAPGDCPELGDPDRLVCTGAAGEDAPMVLDPSATTLDLPGTLTFTLTNGTSSEFTTNFYDWKLLKHVDGRWYRVAPWMVPEPAMILESGRSHSWTVSMNGDDYAGRTVPNAEGTAEVTIGALGGGTYAFAIDGWFGSGDAGVNATFVTRFSLAGDPLTLTTTDALTDVRVSADTVTARWADSDAASADTAVYRVTPTADVDDAAPVIPEQVVRRYPMEPLRDALALATAYPDRPVIIRGQTAVTPPFGIEQRTISFRGTTYRITENQGESPRL